ncbi:hypothetical protein [Spirosoma litoris]
MIKALLDSRGRRVAGQLLKADLPELGYQLGPQTNESYPFDDIRVGIEQVKRQAVSVALDPVSDRIRIDFTDIKWNVKAEVARELDQKKRKALPFVETVPKQASVEQGAVVDGVERVKQDVEQAARHQGFNRFLPRGLVAIDRKWPTYFKTHHNVLLDLAYSGSGVYLSI